MRLGKEVLARQARHRLDHASVVDRVGAQLAGDHRMAHHIEAVRLGRRGIYRKSHHYPGYLAQPC